MFGAHNGIHVSHVKDIISAQVPAMLERGNTFDLLYGPQQHTMRRGEWYDHQLPINPVDKVTDEESVVLEASDMKLYEYTMQGMKMHSDQEYEMSTLASQLRDFVKHLRTNVFHKKFLNRLELKDVEVDHANPGKPIKISYCHDATPIFTLNDKFFIYHRIIVDPFGNFSIDCECQPRNH